MMRHVNLMIKPASSLCNMSCRYCFYKDEVRHRAQTCAALMTAETAATLIDAAFSALDGRGAVSFAFQGGEPTLAGLPFFQRFVDMARRRNTHNLPIAWSLQTNGLLLDEAWIAFLKENNFLVGVSVDGTCALHDAFRPDVQGQGTYARVADSVARLLAQGVQTNLLCVVHGKTAEKPKAVYRALKALKTGYLQFIPCLDPLGVPRGSLPWSLMPEAYGRFLCGVFDEWYKDHTRGEYVSIRQIDDWVHLAMGEAPSSCAAFGGCGGFLVAEADGSLYPCDFYALDEWRLGHVSQGLEACIRSERMKAFQKRSTAKPAACRTCPYAPICRGGCPNDWSHGANYFCPSFRMLFGHATERMLRIAQSI